MKKALLAAALAPALLGATAASAQTYGDVARVLSATPIHERVATPRRECRMEEVTEYRERRSLVPGREEYRPARNEGIGPGTVLGAIVGGVIGHQFGGTSGARDKATGAGAIIGGLIGNSIENDPGPGYFHERAAHDVVVERVPVTRQVQRCDEVADARERVVAYDVRYEYNGREFRTRLPYDPGAQLPVNVEVRVPSAQPSRTYRGPSAPNYRGTF